MRLAGSSARALQGFGALALVAYGCWLAYHPLGFVVAGAGLLTDRIMTSGGGDG